MMEKVRIPCVIMAAAVGLPAINNDHSFAIDDKVYGLAFDMLRSKSSVSVDSTAKMPMGMSFEAVSTLPMRKGRSIKT